MAPSVLDMLLRTVRCGCRRHKREASSPMADSMAARPESPRAGPAPEKAAAPAKAPPAQAEDVAKLGAALRDVGLAESLAASGHVTFLEMRGLRRLAEQSVTLGIDYASLGLGFYKGHPETRLLYRQGRHPSIVCDASRARAERSRLALVEVVRSLAAGGAAGGGAGAAIAAAFAEEASAAPAARRAATPSAALAALEAELLLPLRALNEDRVAGSSMTRTFQQAPLPADKVWACVDEITARVLDGTYAAWRYENPVGARQLQGLTAAQRAKWIEPSRTPGDDGVVAHEDAEGELGLFWATKIGGPSHGFDFEGQCLLPLLANARHKVILVSDPRWPHYPAGRAHFRLLWSADETPAQPVLWLEALNAEFGISFDRSSWMPLVLAHAVRKAEAMGALLSLQPGASQALESFGLDPARISQRQQLLVLRPSNGVVEASDYLSPKHDWLQVEEEMVRQPRTVYEPASAAPAPPGSPGGLSI